MSYAQKRQIGTNRTLAIAIAAIVHIILGYILIAGLAHSVIEKTTTNPKTFAVEEEQPPPPEEEPPPPPPEQAPEIPPQVVAPPPIVQITSAPPPVQTVQEAPPPVITLRALPAPPVPPAPPARLPAPPPVETISPVSATGDLQGLFRGGDYPEYALQAGEQGSVTVRLTVGTNGQVTNCSITSSSRSRALDRATCQILESRAWFTPARDTLGKPTTDTVTQQIRWVLEG